MKKIVSIVLLAMAIGAYAQEPMSAPQQVAGNCVGFIEGSSPYYYCDCYWNSSEFSLPLEMQVTDTMWYTSTVEDLKQGLAAYWFADCSITFEVYAFCNSKAPTIELTVGANQMREMDIATINRKLDEMGDQARIFSEVVKPRIRMYPNGGTGKAYCYPYDQGPHSTCADPLPMIPRMTYVCDQTEEVYEIKPARISSTGESFFRWKQKNNLESTVWLTRGACDGMEIGRAVLSDSLRVFVPNATAMKAAKTANQSVFVHVTHDDGYVGRIYYHNVIKWDVQTIDTTLCQGVGLVLPDTVLYETTSYSNDTLWINADSLARTNYNLTIEIPETQYDTLRLKAKQTPYNYRNQMIPKNGWGDYDLTIHRGGRCDEHVLLHVIHDTVRSEQVIHDVVCVGKTKTYGDVTYSQDTVFRDSLWINDDTWAVRDITITFKEQDPEYDTIRVKPSEFTANGYWYGALGMMVKHYGDTLIVKTKKNTCTRWIYLTVLEAEEGISTDIREPAYPSAPCKYIRDGVLYIRRDGKEYDLLGRPIKH